MKHAKTTAFLLTVILLCTVCLTRTAASAAASSFIALPVPAAENGVLTLRGEEWYRVKHFADDGVYLLAVQNAACEEQILAATDGDLTQYTWYYSRTSMTASDARRIETLATGRFALAGSGNMLLTSYTGTETGDYTWSHDDAALCLHNNGTVSYLKYVPDSTEPFSMTANKAEAADVILYSRSNTLERCITRQPAAESYVIEGSGYAAPVFSVGLGDVTADSIRWFTDDKEQPCTEPVYTADVLTGLPTGIHRVSCIVEAHDRDGVHYREQSAEAAFIIAKGVVPDSILTFSDVHEEYGLIRAAIGTVMQKTGGYVPSLVICTGDLVNGPTVEKNRELNRYFPQLTPNLGGLDTVFVAGNHDSSEAAAVMSANAQLGAAANLPAKGGVIFDGESAAVSQNGKSSRSAKSILTYGINYGAVIQYPDGKIRYTYQNVIRDIDSFLQSAAAQYHGELIVISAHAGLNVVGWEPDKTTDYYEWLGENMYNVELSNELVKTINRYAEQYGMDILYLFGHDHSRGEPEMFLTEGDTIKSPQYYDDRSYEILPMHFTYAHAGYLSSVIGCASKNFAFIQRDGGSFRYDLYNVSGVLVRHAEFPARHPYEEPVTTTAAPAVTTTTTTAAQTTAAAGKAAAPATGDQNGLLLIAVPAVAALLCSRKRRGE